MSAEDELATAVAMHAEQQTVPQPTPVREETDEQ